MVILSALHLYHLPGNTNQGVMAINTSIAVLSHIDITVTATTLPPNSCQLSQTSRYYILQSWDGTEPGFPDLATGDWIDVNHVLFTDIILDDGRTHKIEDSHIEFCTGIWYHH